MAEQPQPLGWLRGLGLVLKADRMARLVEQHERPMRRDRSCPVWIRVNMAGWEWGGVVGKAQYLAIVRHNRCKTNNVSAGRNAGIHL